MTKPLTQKVLLAFLRGSDDADQNNEVLEVIDVDQTADSRMNDLRKKWTAQVRLTQQGKEWEQIQLPNSLIEKLETMIKSKSRRAQKVRTMWSIKEKTRADCVCSCRFCCALQDARRQTD